MTTGGGDPDPGTQASVPVMAVNDEAVAQAQSHFLTGDWENLQSLDGIDAERRSDRSVVALMLLARALRQGQVAEAKTAIANATAWGVGRQPVRRVLLAGVHVDLARVRSLQKQERRAADHIAQARDLLAPIVRDAPDESGAERRRAEVATGQVSPTLAGYATEIRRQRELIADLRKTVKTMRSGGEAARDAELIARILADKLTYLSPLKMASLAKTCRAIEEQKVPGVFIEAGCALGGSAILIASVKSAARPLGVYDVFGMIPPPSDADTPDVHERYQDIVAGRSVGIDGDPYYGYETNIHAIVLRNFRRFEIDMDDRHVELIQGLVQDTLVGSERVAFAHIDLDWYEPVQVCLQRIYPRLSVGGSIILDDYHDWGGCRDAVDKYLAEVPGSFVADDSARSMKITKISEPAQRA